MQQGVECGRLAGHLHTNVKTFDAQFFHNIAERLACDIDSSGGTHSNRQVQAVIIYIGNDYVSRTHMFANACSDDADRACARDQHILTNEIKDCSDIAIRGYVIRSKIPLLGPFIAWARRTLTSHLREPYLDPMIERQVTLNYRVAEWMKRIKSAWTAATRRQTELETRIETLEAQVETLTRRLNADEFEKGA